MRAICYKRREERGELNIWKLSQPLAARPLACPKGPGARPQCKVSPGQKQHQRVSHMVTCHKKEEEDEDGAAKEEGEGFSWYTYAAVGVKIWVLLRR